jgi:hypothetical protein
MCLAESFKKKNAQDDLKGTPKMLRITEKGLHSTGYSTTIKEVFKYAILVSVPDLSALLNKHLVGKSCGIFKQ